MNPLSRIVDMWRRFCAWLEVDADGMQPRPLLLGAPAPDGAPDMSGDPWPDVPECDRHDPTSVSATRLHPDPTCPQCDGSHAHDWAPGRRRGGQIPVRCVYCGARKCDMPGCVHRRHHRGDHTPEDAWALPPVTTEVEAIDTGPPSEHAAGRPPYNQDTDVCAATVKIDGVWIACDAAPHALEHDHSVNLDDLTFVPPTLQAWRNTARGHGRGPFDLFTWPNEATGRPHNIPPPPTTPPPTNPYTTQPPHTQ